MIIEKKYTQEEMKASAENLLSRETLCQNSTLCAEELESVCGGDVGPKNALRYEVDAPRTHAEIDAAWDIVQLMKDQKGNDAALVTAITLHLYEGDPNQFHLYGINVYRKRMHDRLDGKITGLDRYSNH